MENLVAADLVSDAIENVGVNTYSSLVLIKIPTTPVFKEVDLRRLHDGRILAEDP